MKKLKIAIDCDNVLFRNNIVYDVMKKYNIKQSYFSWNLDELGYKAKSECFRRFKLSKYMCNLKPFKGNKNKIVEWYDKGHNLACVSSRIDSIAIKTIDMIEEKFPEITKFFIVNNDKSTVFLNEKFDIVIDDNAENILQAIKIRKTKGILISNKRTPYNFKYIPEFKNNKKITIAKSLKDIYLTTK